MDNAKTVREHIRQGVFHMANQHTENHNEAFSMPGALKANRRFESVVSQRNEEMDNAEWTPIPWKAYHRVNLRHTTRHSS